MKTTMLIILLLSNLTSCSPHRQANNYARKNKLTIIYPQAKFYKEESAKQLATGSVTIKGVLMHKNHVITKSVTLFPTTEYFEWCYRLRKKSIKKLIIS